MVPSVVVVVAATRPSSLAWWASQASAVACTHPLCHLPGLISWFGSNITGCSRATVAFLTLFPSPCTSVMILCLCFALELDVDVIS